MHSLKHKGIFLALLTALISGVSIFVNKYAVTAVKDPLIFTTLKNSSVALVIISLLLMSGKWRKIKLLNKRDKKLLILIGLTGGSIPFYLFFTGLSNIPAVNGAIIQKTLVLWVAVLAIPFLKERMSKVGWFAVILLFEANILVGGFKGFKFSLWEFYILAATILWAVETVIAKKILAKVDPDIVISARMGIGALILIAMTGVLRPQSLMSLTTITSTGLFWIAVTTGLLFSYQVFWYRSLKVLSATSATAILVASTLVTNLLSAIFLTHTVNLLVILQSVMIVAGILVIYWLEIRLNKKSIEVIS